MLRRYHSAITIPTPSNSRRPNSLRRYRRNTTIPTPSNPRRPNSLKRRYPSNTNIPTPSNPKRPNSLGRDCDCNPNKSTARRRSIGTRSNPGRPPRFELRLNRAGCARTRRRSAIRRLPASKSKRERLAAPKRRARRTPGRPQGRRDGVGKRRMRQRKKLARFERFETQRTGTRRSFPARRRGTGRRRSPLQSRDAQTLVFSIDTGKDRFRTRHFVSFRQRNKTVKTQRRFNANFANSFIKRR